MKRRGRIKLLLLILLAALVGEFFNLRFISRQKRELSLKADLRLMRQAIGCGRSVLMKRVIVELHPTQSD